MSAMMQVERMLCNWVHLQDGCGPYSTDMTPYRPLHHERTETSNERPRVSDEVGCVVAVSRDGKRLTAGIEGHTLAGQLTTIVV